LVRQRHARFNVRRLIGLDRSSEQTVGLRLCKNLVERQTYGRLPTLRRPVHMLEDCRLLWRQLDARPSPYGHVLVIVERVTPSNRCEAIPHILYTSMMPFRPDDHLAKLSIVLILSK